MSRLAKFRSAVPLGKTASLVANAFALIAAGVSALGAWLLAEDFGPYVKGVLVALSIVCVLYERNAMSWISARRARNDHKAARLGWALLVIACLYTASMQLTYFGSIMLKGVTADAAAGEHLTSLRARINDLETRRTWVQQIGVASSALREEIAGLERDAKSKDKEAAKAAQDSLRGKRAELAAADGRERIDIDLQEARHALQAAIGRPPADVKGAIFAKLSKGWLPSDTVTYCLLFVAVGLIQLGQISLPSVSGRAELHASQASAMVLHAKPLDITPPAQPQAMLAPPRQQPIVTLKTVTLPTPQPGPLAQQLAERRRKAAEDAAEQERAQAAAKAAAEAKAAREAAAAAEKSAAAKAAAKPAKKIATAKAKAKAPATSRA